MILRIKGEWYSKGRPPKWMPKFMRGWFTWPNTKLGSFDFQRELEDASATYALSGDWDVRITIKNEMATLEVLFREASVWTGKYSFADYEWKFNGSAAGFSIKGSIVVDW